MEAVLPGKDGEAFLRACASCGSMERKDYYSRKLMTSEGPVELPFRGRATLSLRQEPAGRASRLRPAAALQLLLPWKDRHAGCPPPACGVLRTTRHPGLILPRKDGRMVQRLELLLPGKDSPSPPPRSASMPCTCGPSAEGLDEQHRSFRGRTHYRPRDPSTEGPATPTPPSLPRKGFDWLANLFAAQLGLRSRLTAFPTPIHT